MRLPAGHETPRLLARRLPIGRGIESGEARAHHATNTLRCGRCCLSRRRRCDRRRLSPARHGRGHRSRARADGSRGLSLAYDLVSANGTVTSFGHAGNFGGAQDIHLAAPIVGMATTPDGLGYWLIGQDGGVLTFGDAKYFGSLGGLKHTPAHDIIALVPTADGQGYWLCDASGVVTSFGDAPKLPSLRLAATHVPIVGFTVLRDQRGAWVVNADGVVFHLGQSHLYGSIRSKTPRPPIVGIARTENGRGYWLTDSRGNVTAFGNAGPAVRPPALKSPVVGISAAPAGRGTGPSPRAGV